MIYLELVALLFVNDLVCGSLLLAYCTVTHEAIPETLASLVHMSTSNPGVAEENQKLNVPLLAFVLAKD